MGALTLVDWNSRPEMQAARVLTYLVVDDNKFARNFVQTALHSYGVRNVLEAVSAAEATTALKANRIDMLICDVNMPDTDGLAFTRKIRREKIIPNDELPIIIVSGHNDPGTVNGARNAGVHEFVVKPIVPAVLMARILGIIRNPRPFVRCAAYVGPERRTPGSVRPAGEDRRAQESNAPVNPARVSAPPPVIVAPAAVPA